VSPLCSAAATALRGLAKRTCRKFLDFFSFFNLNALIFENFWHH
jgi:hypothetical protein